MSWLANAGRLHPAVHGMIASALGRLTLLPSFGIAEFVVSVCSSDTSKNTSKTIGCSGRFRELLLMFSNAPPKFS
jgi:hypothetical protein